MLTNLETLLSRIKENNAAIGGKVAELQTLLLNRDDLIKDGKKLGLSHTAMSGMLSNVKLRLTAAGGESVPLGDVLQEFDPTDDHGRTPSEIARDEARLRAAYPAPTEPPCGGQLGSDWRDQDIPETIRPKAGE